MYSCRNCQESDPAEEALVSQIIYKGEQRYVIVAKHTTTTSGNFTFQCYDESRVDIQKGIVHASWLIDTIPNLFYISAFNSRTNINTQYAESDIEHCDYS